jgi:hypothetical protein
MITTKEYAEMNNNDLRIIAIAMVVEAKNFLSKIAYVDAMYTAARVRIQAESEKTLEEVIFGKDAHQEIIVLMRAEAQREAIIGSTFPNNLKVLYFKTTDKYLWNLERFKMFAGDIMGHPADH